MRSFPFLYLVKVLPLLFYCLYLCVEKFESVSKAVVKSPKYSTTNMSDNSSVQYKAIKNLHADLVQAISSEIDILINKAWSKDIIGQQQLSSSFDSTKSLYHKASALVSALVARMKFDNSAFGKFLDLLREVQSLGYLADRLENEVEKLSKETVDKDQSSGASNLDTQPGGHQRPPDEMPKLELADGSNTLESGFGEGGQSLGPITGEEQVTGVEGTSGNVHIPDTGSKRFLMSFQTVVGDNDPPSSVVGLVSKNEEDENLSVSDTYGDDKEDVSPISEVVDSGPSHTQHEMVVTANRRKLSELSSSEEALDSMEKTVEVMRRKNETKNEKIQDLQDKLAVNEEELATSKRSEVDLIQRVKDLRKKNEQLEYELQSKEKEITRLKHVHKMEIKALKTQAQEEVQRLKKQLADTEQQNQQQQQELLQRIKELQTELEDTVSKKTDEYRKQELKYREEILTVREELQRMKDKETENLKELCELQVKQAKAETEIANNKAELISKDADLEREKAKNHQIQMELMEKKHQDEIARVNEFHRSNSVPKQMFDDKVNELNSEIAVLKVRRQSSKDSDSDPTS